MGFLKYGAPREALIQISTYLHNVFPFIESPPFLDGLCVPPVFWKPTGHVLLLCVLQNGWSLQVIEERRQKGMLVYCIRSKANTEIHLVHAKRQQHVSFLPVCRSKINPTCPIRQQLLSKTATFITSFSGRYQNYSPLPFGSCDAISSGKVLCFAMLRGLRFVPKDPERNRITTDLGQRRIPEIRKISGGWLVGCSSP